MILPAPTDGNDILTFAVLISAHADVSKILTARDIPSTTANRYRLRGIREARKRRESPSPRPIDLGYGRHVRLAVENKMLTNVCSFQNDEKFLISPIDRFSHIGDTRHTSH